jgi:hypothetical protein
MRLIISLAGTLAITATSLLGAQVSARARAATFDDDRLVLGITTGYGGSRDTLGLLVASVTPGGPADKAGIEEGNRIAAINNVNLRLDPADAGEPEMSGVLTRRLTRELSKVKAGSEVDLRIWADGKYRNIKVKPIAAADLPGNNSIFRSSSSNRAAIGLSLSASGSRRDTLGLMVVRVTPDGPAEKAGIVEGQRLQAINGVDLRVPAEDAGDSWASNARMNRFRRELAKLRADDEVELKVLDSGRQHTVKVKAIRPSDMPRQGGAAFYFGDGSFDSIFDEMRAPVVIPPLPPVLPTPSVAPRARILRFDDEDPIRIRVEPRIQLEMRQRADEIRLRAEELAREAQLRARDISDQVRRQLRNSLIDLRWRLQDDFDQNDDGSGEIVRQPATPAPRADRAPIAPRATTPSPAAPARATSVKMMVSM